MRIHTDAEWPRSLVRQALNNAQYGYPYHVASDVHFVLGPNVSGSRSRACAVEVQLGTYDKTTGPTKSRHYKNTGNYGADTIYAATYDEWGWFLAELFVLDPNAIAGPYKGVDDFNVQTKFAYTTTEPCTCFGSCEGSDVVGGVIVHAVS